MTEFAGYDDWKTTDPRDAERPEPLSHVVCVECAWHGRGDLAGYAHHRATGHQVRGRDWNPTWPNAQFSCCPGCAQAARKSA